MRQLAVLSLLVLTVLAQTSCLSRAPPLPNGPNIPPGDYLNTCTGCFLRYDDTVLECRECLGVAGKKQKTSIYLDECKTFTNDNGKLACSFTIDNSDDNDVPYGPYLDSCGGCFFMEYDDDEYDRFGFSLPEKYRRHHRVLACTECLDNAGKKKLAEMELGTPIYGDCKEEEGWEVQNINGELSCERMKVKEAAKNVKDEL